MHWKRFVKMLIPDLLIDGWRLRKHAYPRECSICGYRGRFQTWFGPTLVRDNSCPNCNSHPRHRLFWLWYRGEKARLAQPILHFAPEKVLKSRFEHVYDAYKTADLFGPADLRLNIEDIALDAGSFKTIICNHVFEHVEDSKAMRELCRILSDDGVLICSVPLAEGWERTYEDAAITDPAQRTLHFDQDDHVRYYGRDFRDRLRAAGFHRIEEVTAGGADVVRYALARGEKIFFCSKH